MSRKSAAGDLVRRAADDVPPATQEHLAHLLTATGGPIDTSEIPETKGRASRVQRDDSGRMAQVRPGLIRQAILEALKQREMTRYQLWRDARTLCPTLNQSAVCEYLRGQRDIGVLYVEALLEAAGLVVSPLLVRPRKAGKAAASGRRAGKVDAV